MKHIKDFRKSWIMSSFKHFNKRFCQLQNGAQDMNSYTTSWTFEGQNFCKDELF